VKREKGRALRHARSLSHRVDQPLVAGEWIPEVMNYPPGHHPLADVVVAAWDRVEQRYPRWLGERMVLPVAWRVQPGDQPVDRIAFMPAEAAAAICSAAGVSTAAICAWLSADVGESPAMITWPAASTWWPRQLQVQAEVLKPANAHGMAGAREWVERFWPEGPRNPAVNPGEVNGFWWVDVVTEYVDPNPTVIAGVIDSNLTAAMLRSELREVGMSLSGLIVSPTLDPAAGVITGWDSAIMSRNDIAHWQEPDRHIVRRRWDVRLSDVLGPGWSMVAINEQHQPVMIVRVLAAANMSTDDAAQDRMLSALKSNTHKKFAAGETLWEAGPQLLPRHPGRITPPHTT